MEAALGDPKMKGRLAELGSVLMPMSRADFAKLIADETEKWGEVVKFAGLGAE
jgi:tripartite-type tricarboxylate transporter receptor subunit TctC